MTQIPISMEQPAQSQVPLPHACTECRRRKQKCDRQWPCNHCQKRKVVDQCRFKDDSTTPDQPEGAWAASSDVKRKLEQNSSDDERDTDAAEVLEAIGYSRGHVLAKLDEERNKKTPGQYCLDPGTSPQLQRALDILPPRHIVDTLVQNFLDVVNFYYYIVYPPNFSKEYATWWKDHNEGRPHGVPWTCLLLMVCACSVQHMDAQLGHDMEEKLGASAKELTLRYHDAARELHSAIPVGEGHIYSVQYLLHSCYWFKAEARFAECWQVLGAVVREAQMIDLHKKPVGQMPGFELEMKRRLWCIVDSWDWLVSSLLARPMLIDRAECDVGLPSLTFEDYPASPMLHLKLQAELVGLIFKRFGPPKILDDPNDIQDYQVIMEAFMKTFPPEYAMDHPNTTTKNALPWIALHRHYMHTCTLAIALGPFRGYMAKSMTKNHTPAIELKFRQDGVNYALQLMDAVHRFFEYVWTRDTTFHFVPFCIFDTAALLCSAILHDEDGSIPQREEITDAIARAYATLRKLRTATATAKAPYDVLRRLIKKLPLAIKANADDAHKRRRFDPPPPPSGSTQPAKQSSVGSSASNAKGAGSGSGSAQADGNQSGTSQDSYSQAPGLPPTDGDRMGQIEDTLSSVDLTPQGSRIPSTSSGSTHHPPSDNSQSTELPYAQPNTIGGDGGNFTHVQPPPDAEFQVISDAELGDLAMLWNWQSLDLGFTSNPIYQQ